MNLPSHTLVRISITILAVLVLYTLSVLAGGIIGVDTKNKKSKENCKKSIFLFTIIVYNIVYESMLTYPASW